MKHSCRTSVLLFFFFSFAVNAFSQLPQAIPYQGVARDSNGDVISNQNISIRFTIHDATANGATLYQETHSASINSLGLFTLNIGQGIPVTGNFSSIAWGINSKFLQVEMDVAGGNNFIDMGTQQLMSVPYALYAGSAPNGLPSGDANGNTLRWNGTSWVIDSTLTNKGTNIGIGNPSPNSSAALDVTSTSKGFLMPRMTTAQRNAIISPAVGLQIFNTDDQCVDIYDGANWIETCGLKVIGTSPLPGTNSWSQKASFVSGRSAAVHFSIGSKGYFGTGWNNTGWASDFWEYDSGNDSWTQKASFASNRTDAVGFSIGNKGYLGIGFDFDSKTDFYEFDPVANSWTQKATFPGPPTRNAVGFSLGGKGYVGTGSINDQLVFTSDFYEYDPVADSWSQKTSFPGNPRNGAFGFSIGNKGYIGTGSDSGTSYADFWEYDPVSDTWMQKADFGGGTRSIAIGVSVGNKAYAGTGADFGNLIYKDFWEYDPLTDAWTQVTDFGGSPRYDVAGFSIGDKLYVGTGSDGSLKNDFWEYTPSINLYNYSSLPPASAGTVNFGEWTQSGSAIYNSNSGNVGIGTSNPSQKLDVTGTIKTTSFQMTGGATVGGIFQSDSSGNGNWINSTSIAITESDLRVGMLTNNKIPKWSTTSLADGSITDNGTNVGIGTTSPTQKLDVNGTTRTTNFQMTSGAVSGRVLQSDVSGNATWTNIESDPKVGTLTSNRIPKWNTTTLANSSVTDDGTNVGIGTTSPSQKLDVAGTIRTTNFQMTNGAASARVLQSDASGNASWLAENDPKVGSLNLFFIPKWSGSTFGNSTILDGGGPVGIGTSTPRGRFDVSGTGDIWLSSNGINSGQQSVYLPGYIFIAPYDGSNISYLQARRSDNSGTTTLRLRTYNGGSLTESIDIEGNGNVGIGTTAPSQKLEVVGVIKTTNFQIPNFSGIALYLQSDPLGNTIWGSTTTEKDPKVGTLTFNKIPRWGGSALVDGTISDDLTNVGIGTTAPSQKLEVVGTTKTTNFQMTSGADAGEILLSDGSGNASWGTVVPIVETDPKVGTLTTNIVPKWDGSTLANAIISDYGTGVGINMPPGSPALSMFAVNGGVSIGNSYSSTVAAPTGGMVIEGKVGIGTFNLTQMLEVAGTTKTTALQVTTGAGTGKILQSDASGNATWVASTSIAVSETDAKVGSLTSNLVPKWNGSALANGLIYDNGTNIGIGTSSPSQKLEVSGTTKTNNFQMTTGAAGGKVLQSDASGNASWTTLASIETDPKFGSLTTNMIPKWNGNSLSNGIVFDNGSNIGIGTTTPGAKLDVSGGAIRTDNQLISTVATGTAPITVASTTKVTNLNADLLDGNDGSFYQNINNLTGAIAIANGSTGTSTAFSQGSVVFAGSSGVYSQNNANLFWDNTNSRLGIGTTAPADKLSIQGGALSFHNTSNNVPYVGIDYGTSNTLRLLANVGGTSLNTTYVHIRLPTGNFGIGTIIPSNKLDVVGNAAIGATYSGTNTAPTSGAIIEGNVGIGTSSPVNKLDVEGGVAIGAAYSGFTTAPTNGAVIEGNVGIGTSSPVNKLDVEGGAAVGATYSGTTAAPANGAIMEGNVVIGGTTSANKLDVEGSMAIGSSYAGSAAASSNYAIIQGAVGVGTNSPASTLDVNGSLGVRTFYGLSSSFTPDAGGTVWIYTGASPGANIPLPAASSCPNRFIILLNYVDEPVTVSSYVNLSNTNSTSFPNGTSLWLVSDGSTWNQVK